MIVASVRNIRPNELAGNARARPKRAVLALFPRVFLSPLKPPKRAFWAYRDKAAPA
jgi:hypothetical protein